MPFDIPASASSVSCIDCFERPVRFIVVSGYGMLGYLTAYCVIKSFYCNYFALSLALTGVFSFPPSLSGDIISNS